MIQFGQRRMTNARGHAKWGRTGPPRFSLLDSDGSASTGARDMEILSGQIFLGVRVGQQRYKHQQQSNRFFMMFSPLLGFNRSVCSHKVLSRKGGPAVVLPTII